MNATKLDHISLSASGIAISIFAGTLALTACEVDDPASLEDASDSDFDSESDGDIDVDDETDVEFRQVDVRDMRLGIQIADYGYASPGSWEWTAPLENAAPSTWSWWAHDLDHADPDSARLNLNVLFADGVAGKDVRACIRASDYGPSYGGQGTKRCTPWASQGGGNSGFASDSDLSDPDSYRVILEVQDWPTNVDKVLDFRFRIRAWDDPGAFSDHVPGPWSSYTPWASQGGGSSGWALDGDDNHDPDGFEIGMNVRNLNIWTACSALRPCEDGFGDCDSDAECAGAATCWWNVGNYFGYSNSGIDVCVE